MFWLEKDILKSIDQLTFKPNIKKIINAMHFRERMFENIVFACDKRANSSKLDHYIVLSALDHN